jgi:alkylation response protein AidB-like acyl-CoA dehydrogenase
VKVPKNELVGQENRGWSIAKRLLQHERSSISGLGGGGRNRQAGSALQVLAKRYCGEVDGKIADDEKRRRVLGVNMDTRAFLLTQQRASVEDTSGGTPTFATSMFKYFSAELAKRRQELTISLLGTQGVGWEGTSFEDDEIAATRMWLRGKAGTIAGGTSEVQLNIVAKRVLGLPD